jgi:methyltransferase (TIGR00027 family)
VAASRAFASREPEPLIDDPYAAILVDAVGMEHFARMARGEIDFDGQSEDPLLTGRQIREQIAVRTRYFDDFFTAAGAAGIRQAVILASGLDTRAYRLPWPTGTVVYEIDQPDVIEFKTRVLADAGVEPTADRRPIAVDLRDDWPKALRDSGFDPSAPTAWIAEGLLIYLPPDAQDRLLDSITELSASGSRLATEHMDARALTGDWAKKLSERGRRYGSDIDLEELFYTGPRTAARDHLRELGWRVEVARTAESYAANGFEPPDNDLLSLAGDSGYLSAQLGTK